MTKERTKIFTENDRQTEKDKTHQLVLINDQEHTFEYVIDALIEVCNHTTNQATQCTIITHYKGKCDIKRGRITELRKMRQALIQKELKALIY